MATRKTKANTPSAIPQSAGMGMLALFRDLWRTFLHKDNLDIRKGGPEHEGVYEVMRSMSFVRPVTAMEALAQAVFIQNEIGDPANSADDLVEMSERVARRAIGLVLWIEQTHGIDRREFGLDDFCSRDFTAGLFPDAPLKSPRVASRKLAVIETVVGGMPQAAE